MEDIKKEVIKILDVIEESTKTNLPEELDKIQDIEKTKMYILGINYNQSESETEE